MRKRYIFISMLILLFCSSLPAQSAADSVYGMKTLFLCLLHKGESWRDARSDGDDRLLSLHAEYWKKLAASHAAILFGPVPDTSSIREIAVLEVDSLPAAFRIVTDDPMVQSGLLKADIRPWFAGRNVIVTDSLSDFMTTFYFGLLVKGPGWTPEKTPEVQKIQEGHMANINRLAGLKKLVLAGPFMDGKDLRGVFIFDVATLNEARELAATDPAVQAGRLAVRLHPWILPANSFRTP